MIRVDTEEERYRKMVVLTLDEDGVKGLVQALSALPRQLAVKHIDLVVNESYMPLRVQFEPKAEREQREREREEADRKDAERRREPAQPSVQ